MNRESLARAVPHAAPGAVVALSLSGRVIQDPTEGQTVRFGRNRPDVDLCVGETDLRVNACPSACRERAGCSRTRTRFRCRTATPHCSNALNDNLLRELVLSTTLVPADLELLHALS